MFASMRRLAIAASLAVGVLLGAVVGAQDTVKIGVGAPMTGRSAAFGIQVRYGVEAAVEELNAKGGILGKKVEFVMKDDESSANSAAVVAQSLAGDKDIVAVIGHFNSDCSSAAKPIYTEAGIVMFSPASTNVEITKNSDWVFRNIFNDRSQGEALALYVAKAMKMKKVAVLYENDTYGRGLAEYFKGKAKELGLEITNDLSYESDATDFRPLLTQLRATKPDVIVTAGLYKSGGTISRQARELGLRQPLLGGDGMFSDELAKIGGAAAEGYIVSCPFIMEADERAIALRDKIKAKNGVDGDVWAALAHDAVMIIAEAATRQNSTAREAIRNGIAGMNDRESAYQGITGTTYFDVEGDTVKNVFFGTIKGGKFVPAPVQLPE